MHVCAAQIRFLLVYCCYSTDVTVLVDEVELRLLGIIIGNTLALRRALWTDFKTSALISMSEVEQKWEVNGLNRYQLIR